MNAKISALLATALVAAAPFASAANVAAGAAVTNAGSGFGVSGEYVDESSSQADSKGFYGQLSYAPPNMRCTHDSASSISRSTSSP